nr:3D protein [Rhimavirus A]
AQMRIEEKANPIAYVPRDSALTKSPFYGFVEPTKAPAVLRQTDRRLGEGVVLDTQIFSKYKGDEKPQWASLAPACQLYFSKFPNTQFKALTMDEAINGIPGLDGIDMNQSAGYPYVSAGRTRRSFFVLNDNGRYEPTMELTEQVEKVLAGEYGTYMTFLKDELRDDAKVESGNTRIVDAANLPSIVAGRMIYGSLFAYLHLNVGIKHGNAVGCDPDRHWTQFYQEFLEFDNVWDLDYKNYDASIPSYAFNLLGEQLEKICEHPQAKPYVQHLAKTQHVYGDVLYSVTGGMPSGCVGTSIFNTMLNNIFVLSALITHPDFDPLNYAVLAYGDDVLYSCEPNIRPEYIKEFYEKHTNFTVTPADKNSEFPEESTIHDVKFLKRWFYPDMDHIGLVRPIIDPSVYYQSIMWMRKGDIQDTITSLCYLAFHSGPNNYKKWVDTAMRWCSKYSFLPWSYLDYRWRHLVLYDYE